MKRLALAGAVIFAVLLGGVFVGALGALTDEEWPEW